MEIVRGGYYSTTRFRFVRKYRVKSGTLYYITSLLWCFKSEGGHWTLHSLVMSLRIVFTPIASAIDTARIVLTWLVVAAYKSIIWLINQLITWLLDLAKILISQAFSTVSGKFFGTLFFIAALFFAYIFFFDSTLWRDAKELIVNVIP